jgi:hypothetical protein
MKTNRANNLVALLNRINDDLDAFSNPDARAAFLDKLDSLIIRLNAIRAKLTNPAMEDQLSEIGNQLEQVINFFECAKTDELLGILLSDALEARSPRPKRTAIEIPADLQNDQIRSLLQQDLSKQELKVIAAQRGISLGNAKDEEVRRNILRAIDRQEGYERLASTRPVS